MPTMKLTKNSIDALEASARDTMYWDTGLPGFGLKVTPKGRKVFVALYRTRAAARAYANTRLGVMGRSPFIKRAELHSASLPIT